MPPHCPPAPPGRGREPASSSASPTAGAAADDMAIIVEDLVKLLDGIGADLRRGRYPRSGHAGKVAAMLRRVADELDS